MSFVKGGLGSYPAGTHLQRLRLLANQHSQEQPRKVPVATNSNPGTQYVPCRPGTSGARLRMAPSRHPRLALRSKRLAGATGRAGEVGGMVVGGQAIVRIALYTL